MKFRLIPAILLFSLISVSCTAQADTAPATSLTNDVVAVDIENASSAEALCITDGGEHILSGVYDGTVVVDAEELDVVLVLDGVNITSGGKAAIYVKSANSVTITLADFSENTIVGKKGIHSTADLTINGSGNLSINATEGHGIVSRKSVTVTDGNCSIISPKDGIHASNDTEPDSAFIRMDGGTISVTSDGDGIYASGSIEIDDGEINVVSGGGIENAVEHEDDFDFMGGMRNFFGFGGDSSENDTSSETDDTVQTSFKSLKADGDIVIRGGKFTLESAEDTIHTNSNITIDGGEYFLTSGDDAIHADLSLVINDGTIQIYDSYEGIEAKTIDVNGGDISLRADDDGFNASGGTSSSSRNPMAAEEGVYLKFSGGTVFVNADGDGVDSNGDLIVDGGELYVAGPTDSANGALDSSGDATVNGGIVIAVGDSGMAETFGSQSTQGSIMVNTGKQSAGSTVTLADSDGNVILSRTFDKEFSNVVVSCPEITDGGTYTITAGTYSESVTMDGLQYGSGGGFGNFGGGGGFGGGFFGGGRKDKNDNDNRRPSDTDNGEAPQMPEGEVPQMPEGEAPQMPEGGFDPGAMGGERPDKP